MRYPTTCLKCDAPLDPTTDGMGNVLWIHPVTKCVPKPPPVFEEEDPEEAIYPQKLCAECGELFLPAPRSPHQVVCGAVCRGVRDYRLKTGRRIDREGAWELIKRTKTPKRAA